MPPRKRKAASPSAGGGDDDGDGGAIPAPKKSKKELRAEAKARARMWHEQRAAAAGGGGGSAKKAPSTPPAAVAAATAASDASSSSAGKDASAVTGRRRTPSRKSTGGIGAGSRATTTSARLKREPAEAKRSRRSAGPSFEFRPPVEEEEEQGEESSPEKKEVVVQSSGPESKIQSHAKRSRYKFGAGATDGNDDEDSDDDDEVEKKPSVKKKREREEGRARIRALKERRESRGLPTEGPNHHHARSHERAAERKSPPEEEDMRSPDPPAVAFVAANAASTGRLKSPDPSSAAEPVAAAAAASASSVAPSKPQQRASMVLPPSVASLFSRPRPPGSSSAHRPAHKQKFDPSGPFPPSGHRLPTAAYCGCGPTPMLNPPGAGSRGAGVAAARETVAGGGVGSKDLCTIDERIAMNAAASGSGPKGRNNSFTSTDRRDRMGAVSSVNPSYQERLSGISVGDERKIPERPSPPGRSPDGEGMVPDSAPAAADTTPIPAPLQAAATVPASPGATTSNGKASLLAAMSRARDLVSSAAKSNDIRRETMGIRSGGDVGVPPRGVMQTEIRKDPAVGEMDGAAAGGNAKESAKALVDPPTADSSPINYAETLNKLREVGGVAKALPEVKVMAKAEDKLDDSATAATDAGRETSEARENNVDVEVVAGEGTELEDKPSLSLKRRCLAMGKFMMLVQMAMGIIYLAMYKSFDWNGDWNNTWNNIIALAPKKLKSGEALVEHVKVSPCFVDYPTNWGKEVDTGEWDNLACEGNYKQCPPWGRCLEGKLRDCDDGEGTFKGIHRFVPSLDGDACVSSQEANDIFRVVQESLMGMTSADSCGSSERVRAPDMILGDPFPLFSLEKVVEKISEVSGGNSNSPISSDLLVWLMPAFDSDMVKFGSLSGDDGDKFDALGLGDGILPSSLPLPFVCTVKLVMWELIEIFCRAALALFMFLGENGWLLVYNYPFHAFGFILACKFIAYVRRRRKHRAKVRELHRIVLEAVYDRLSECEDREGYAALILRDDVSHDMYPTNARDRLFMNDHVWSRIVLEIRADNRVRKFRKQTNGKDLEHWDFAVQSKRGRRLRKSLGTPGGKKGEETDGVISRRDP